MSSRSCGLLLVVMFVAMSHAARAESLTDAMRLESDLLHQRLDFGGVEVWQRTAKAWVPLGQDDPADVRVVNLWSRSCPPCLAEFRTFAQLLATKYRQRTEVQFLFIADPGQETSQAQVVEFWTHPRIELRPGEPCEGHALAAGPRPECLLELPDVDPAWSGGERLAHSLRQHPPLASRPVTLLVDAQGVVRQAFAGSILARRTELTVAIDKLLSAVHINPAAAARRSGSEKRRHFP